MKENIIISCISPFFVYYLLYTVYCIVYTVRFIYYIYIIMRITSLQPILDAFDYKDTWWVTELSYYLQKNRPLIHRYLKELLTRGELMTSGSGPHTVYKRTKPTLKSQWKYPEYLFDYQKIQYLEQYFYKFAPNGELLTGSKGFVRRCIERKLDPSQKIDNFITIAKYIEKSKNSCWLIDVTKDFKQHIEWWAIDKLFYADQYKWMEFGRGKLAELTFYAKDNQSMQMITQSINFIKNQLECLIRHEHVDAIAFAPHSRKRTIQLLHELKKKLNIFWLPLINLVKYAPYRTIVAQKTLKTREQRIQNARQTILVDTKDDFKKYKKVLLIDDFVWSGATLNETAKKLKHYGVEQVIWFAWVGNTNLTYEVINEI